MKNLGGLIASNQQSNQRKLKRIIESEDRAEARKSEQTGSLKVMNELIEK